MTNRCYLSCSDSPEIYPSFSDPSFDIDKSWIDHGAGCLPLIWLPLFSESDLTSKEFTVDGQTFTEIAPLANRLTAIERLKSRRAFLNAMFAENGGLDYHIDIFLQHLETANGEFLTAEVQEISWLLNTGVFNEILKGCLNLMDNNDQLAKEDLIFLSTIMPERKFLTKQDFEKVNFETDQEDSWNFFRILGEAYTHPVPWEHH
jgi:hypothetical protein